MSTPTVGDRLQSVRKRRGLTQRELAEASGVSVSLIRQLEQGVRDDTCLETARKLAVALQVRTSELIVRPDADDADAVTVEHWAQVRRALERLPEDQPSEPPTVEGIDGVLLREAVPLYRETRWKELALIFPTLLRDADVLADETPEARSLRFRLFYMVGTVLTQTRQYRAAELALQRALDSATGRLESAAVVNTMAWLLIRQGRLAETRELATRWADDIEPRMSRATLDDLAAWGMLLIRISTSAVRDNRPGEAEDTMRYARTAAVAMGHEYAPHADYLRTFGPTTWHFKRAENLMITDRPDRVIAMAGHEPRSTQQVTASNRNRHRLDVANAHVRLRQYPEAFQILQDIRRDNPEWLPHQRYARDVMGRIVDRRRTLTPEMRDLSDFIGLPY
ncbi:helix-turn-helix domain-containing protein [Actinomadura rupiterrae]|uniref:helix-turn-helix domain-containing protein n=1 Tax=Actinomadura rupiterrae TaxID=559627 RepID=UPI0020A520E8|nr:helix-turn-helix transcriptional regulator [Actinomadura rupiterrae]MCP2336511.1 transcriptional regulator with XRE-family HTH domain [Actinomadura rupiterrae]